MYVQLDHRVGTHEIPKINSWKEQVIRLRVEVIGVLEFEAFLFLYSLLSFLAPVDLSLHLCLYR